MAQILFPLFEQVILAPIHAARAAAHGGSAGRGEGHGNNGCRSGVRRQGVGTCARKARAGGVIVVSGSVYLVGEARALLLGGEGAQA